MKLKSKQIEFAADRVANIAEAIKCGKERELPIPIYHAYEKGNICIGVNNIVIALVGDRYEMVNSRKYLLVCSLGGEISILDDLFSLKCHYDIVSENNDIIPERGVSDTS